MTQHFRNDTTIPKGLFPHLKLTRGLRIDWLGQAYSTLTPFQKATRPAIWLAAGRGSA